MFKTLNNFLTKGLELELASKEILLNPKEKSKVFNYRLKKHKDTQ